MFLNVRIPIMLCSNCQRPLPDSMVCASCADGGEEELALAPAEDLPVREIPGGGALGVTSATADGFIAQEVYLEPEEAAEQAVCRKCRAVIPNGRLQCAVCGYNPQLSREFDPLELDEYDGAMGFDRFLMKHTSQNDPGNLILWFRIFLVFVLAVYIVTARDLISFVTSGVIIGVYIGYLFTMGQRINFHAGRSAIPRFVLLVNRLSGWTGVATNPKAPDAVITNRGGKFGDEQLAAIENTDSVEILDIPSTGITNTGILYLQSFPNLKGLVVQGCQVSDESLDVLQRFNKSVLIWR